MNMRRRHGSTPRSAALIALAALAVHQLRYLLAFGSDAHTELLRQGHAYLFQSLPVLIGFGLSAIAAGLLRAVLRGPAGTAIESHRLRALLYASSIAAVFAVQETAEGLLFAGHASGIAAVFAAGGWLALPLAMLFGGLCAALDGGLAKLESLVARSELRRPRPRAPRRHRATSSRAAVPLASLPLAFGLARRPPPLAS
jgi:hypothetical protein